MIRERGRPTERVESHEPGSPEELLRTMPVWADRLIPPDLVFDVNMRRRVLARVPETLARESRRRVMRALRVVAVAAAALIMVGGVAIDLRAQVPPVVREAPGHGLLMSAPAGEVGVASTPGPGAGGPGTAGSRTAGSGTTGPGTAGPDDTGAVVSAGETGQATYSAKAAPARVRLLPVLAAAPLQGKRAAGDGQEAQGGPEAASADAPRLQVPGLAWTAGTEAGPDMQEVRLTEALAYAGTVSGQAVVVTGTGRVWRYVEGSLVGGESLLPAVGETGCLVLLPGRDVAEALWVDDQGSLRLNGRVASVSLSGRVQRLAPVAGGAGPTAILAAGTLRRDDGYEVGLWVVAWQQGGLQAEELGGPPHLEPARPDVIDLAAFRGDRGLTVYLTVKSDSQQTSYLGEARDGRLRWRKLTGPLFRPGTVVASSASLMAGVDPAGRVAVLEWVPGGGISAWFRPGWYRVRQLSFPELGDALRSVYFFDPDGTGQEGLLLVGEAGRVGYVDASLVARR